MTTSSSSARHASWVRVRLSGPRDPKNPDRAPLTDGELVLRADRVAVNEGTMLFFCADEVVFELDRRYFRSMAWFVDRPTFAEWLRSRRATFPNQHRPWTAEERTRLDDEIGLYGMDWEQIAKAHGRTVAAVKQQAKNNVTASQSEAS